MSWSRSILVLLTVGLALPLVPSPSRGAADAVREAKRREKPLQRVYEMIDWVAAEQQDDGGWAHRMWLPIRFHTQSGNGASKPKVPPQSLDKLERMKDDARRPKDAPQRPKDAPQRTEQERLSFLPTSFDTAMCGLALLRAGSTLSTGDYKAQVRRAADYLYQAVQATSDNTANIDEKPTPLTDRIGPRADTFAALIFFVTLRDREMAALAKFAAAKGEKAPDAGAFTYQASIDKLLKKTQDTLGGTGRWPAEGTHAPMLSHALGCWALEAAMRAGLDVRPEVLAAAEQYAMSKEAEQTDLQIDGRWKKEGAIKQPKWMANELLDDEEPVAHTTYIMSARLSILYQADLTDRALIERERHTAAGRTMSAAQYEKANAMSAAASRTRAALEAGRETMRKTWTTAHKHDVQPCPAPLLFTGEDYLSSLMVVDAMSASGDVQKWFPPLVQYLMARQDTDGGLKLQNRIQCKFSRSELANRMMGRTHPGEIEELKSCLCSDAGPDILGTKKSIKELKEKLNNPLAEYDLEPQFCPMQKSWCAKDRTFITAAGTMMLLADTPYRAAFLGAR